MLPVKEDSSYINGVWWPNSRTVMIQCSHLIHNPYSYAVSSLRPGQNRSLFLVVVTSLYSPLIWNSYSTFILYFLTWEFWIRQASYFVDYSSVWLVWYFFMIRFGLYIFGRKTTKKVCLTKFIVSGALFSLFILMFKLSHMWSLEIS